MYRYKAELHWRKFEFNATKGKGKDNPYIQMITDIETTLIDEELLRLPVAYIRPEVDEELREKICGIIEAHRGEITTDEENATHIIYPEVDTSPDDYARPLFKRNKNVMMHWYYLPESYDSWVPNTFDLPVCE